MAKTKNMTEGNPVNLILTFALPLMLGNVFQQFYTVVDTMVVGQSLGVSALASLGAADWLNWLMLSTAQGFAQGFSIRMAHEFGAGEDRKLCRTVGNSMVLALLLAVILLGIGQGICRPVLQLLQTPDDIIGGAVIYLRIMYGGIPVVMAYNLFASILRALGDGRTPLCAMVIASLLNVGLDFLFVVGFGWGIPGAASATVLSQLVSALFCLVIIRRVEILRFVKKDFLLSRDLCFYQLRLAFPMAFQNAVISVGGMIVQSVVNGFGVLFIAGFTATNKLYGLLEMAAISYGYAMTTYTGQNIGAKKIGRVSQGMHAALLIAMVTSVLIALIMLICGKWILSLFISGTPEECAIVLDTAYFYLTVMSVCLPILYVLHVTRCALQGMGDTVRPMVSGIAEFVMRTGSALIIPLLFGERGVFFAEPLAWFGADLILVPSYLLRMHKLKADFSS